MGLETEYAVAIPAANGMQPHEICAEMIAIARKMLAHLRAGGGGGIFTGNGSRLYIDTGGHPELATPETDNPDDCVRYAMAGDAMVGDVLARVAAEHPGARDAVLYKCNVDYTRPGTTWAAHESYLHTCSPADMPEQLIPHLVSRVIFGAGGLDPRCPGIRFSLSPRAHLFVTDISECSTSTRGIYHTRNEPLAPNGFHRLHVICGDSLCSHLALWLKVASTALIVGMIEAGLTPGDAVRLKHPVKTLHAFAGDPTLTARGVTRDDRLLTALEIQRHYLEQAEAALSQLPAWAPAACARWRDMLDRLDADPRAAERCLDWGTKLAFFEDRLRGRGFDPADLPHWNEAIRTLRNALRRRVRGPVTAAAVREQFPQPMPSIAATLGLHGLEWDGIEELLDVRAELCEIDVRFTQVQPRGLFAAIEGELDHRVPGVDDIDGARETAPATTRAALRGRSIRRFSGRHRFEAGWEYVIDARGRLLDLSDPFGLEARWTRRPRTPSRSVPHEMRGLYETCRAAYRRGDLGRLVHLLDMISPGYDTDHPTQSASTHIYRAWAFARTGRLDAALETLHRIAALRGDGEMLAPEFVAVYRFQPLIPREAPLWAWIERTDTLIEMRRLGNDALPAYFGHKGFALSRRGGPGDLAAAEGVLRCACAVNPVGDSLERIVARNCCDLADVLRLRGRREEAAGWLDRAASIFRRNTFTGEHADHYASARAKLIHAETTDRARRLLSRARSAQRVLGRDVGLVRTLLLDARICGRPLTARRRRREVESLVANCPDLAACPRLRLILDRWDEWIGDLGVSVDGDEFWLV